jgi:(R)-2-hydroxyacyl-CoA dehydratese activating ATPase
MYLGIDIGSSSSKAVALSAAGVLCGEAIFNIGTGSKGPKLVVEKVLELAKVGKEDIKKCVVTGYGRMMYEDADKQITEISCHAKAISHFFPKVRTIIDIGGQDAKIIRLSERGSVENFVMNEKCAAGTGRFLEVMARVFDCNIGELSELADNGSEGVFISSTCTVFAESEVISQLATGKKLEDVALGVHISIAQRINGLCNRIGVIPEVAMTGGVALNRNVVRAIEKEIHQRIALPENPQIMGAFGAALYAIQLDQSGK